MGTYKSYNGKTGYNAIYHVTSGYKCLAKLHNPEDSGKNVEFIVKHIVESDGRPYTEVSFTSKESFNRKELMFDVKKCLESVGLAEVYSIFNCKLDERAYSEWANPIPNTIQLRVHAGAAGVELVFQALADYISKDCLDFVHDQEEDMEENLFHSLMESLGDELAKSPGGKEAAVKRARDMAHTFITGFELPQ